MEDKWKNKDGKEKIGRNKVVERRNKKKAKE